MLEVDKRKNYNDNDEFGIMTDQGEFIVSREDSESIYVGYPTAYIAGEKNDEPIKVQITKENYDVYQIFNNLYERLVLCKNIEKNFPRYIVSSYDFPFFKGSESSELEITKDEETETLSLVFKKSKSKKCINSYFVKFSGKEYCMSPEYHMIELLLNELRNYSPNHRQIHMDEYLYRNGLSNKNDITRKRSKVNSVK